MTESNITKTNNLRVFRMNDLECVCAENEREAKEFYAKHTIFHATLEQINRSWDGEVNLDEHKWVSMDWLTPSEIASSRLWKPWASTYLVQLTYREFIERMPQKAPYIFMDDIR